MKGKRVLFYLSLVTVSGMLAFAIAVLSERRAEATASKTPLPQKTPPMLASREISRTAKAEAEARMRESDSPLPLARRKIERVDATNYEVSVSQIELEELGEKVERESLLRLQELTNRYQLTANQRREAFPLLVSYHADFTPGLIVNGYAARPPRAKNLASELYLILDLTQQETYQEDVLADHEWWAEIINQLRGDLDESLFANEATNGDRDPWETGSE